MNKNLVIVIAILLVLVVGEGVYALKKRHDLSQLREQMMASSGQPTQQKSPGPKPMLLEKGMKLADNPIAQFATKIAPGDLTDSAKAVMTGFNMTSKPQADGSVIVSLMPKDSDDQAQQYTVKKGETLYFIEQTPVDDNADKDVDMNYRDDYGVIVDANGIVQ
jgi:hypothetical protein